jgi:hypothetical protein
MPQSGQTSALHLIEVPTAHVEDFSHPNPRELRVLIDSMGGEPHRDPLLTAEDVATRLNVSKDCVWTIPHARPHISQLSGWAMAPSDADRVGSKRSSAKGNTSLLYGPAPLE